MVCLLCSPSQSVSCVDLVSHHKGQNQVKSRFTLLGGKKAICRGSGPDWRAGAGARVWSPLPPGLSKESGER